MLHKLVSMSSGSALGDVRAYRNGRSAHLRSICDLVSKSQLFNELVRYDAQVNCSLPHLKFFVAMYCHLADVTRSPSDASPSERIRSNSIH